MIVGHWENVIVVKKIIEHSTCILSHSLSWSLTSNQSQLYRIIIHMYRSTPQYQVFNFSIVREMRMKRLSFKNMVMPDRFSSMWYWQGGHLPVIALCSVLSLVRLSGSFIRAQQLLYILTIISSFSSIHQLPSMLLQTVKNNYVYYVQDF